EPLFTDEPETLIARCVRSLLRLSPLLALVRGLQILGRLFQRALGVVLSPLGLLVLVHCALALASDIEDPAQMDMRPNVGPLRLQIPVLHFAKFIRRRLV